MRRTRYAGFWKRFIAVIIDMLVLVVLAGIAGAFLGFPFNPAPAKESLPHDQQNSNG